MKMTRRTLLGASLVLPFGVAVTGASQAKGISGQRLTPTLTPTLTTSLDRPDELVALLRGKRVAILTHAAGVNRFGQRSIDVLRRLPGVRLTSIWSPEHGLAGQAAAGEHVSDDRDAESGLPIFSLYGKSNRPSRVMLEMADVIFVDLQDVGVRPYTYISTVAEVLKAAAQAGKPIFLNDRPNPLGGGVMEGPVLDPKLASFVGVHPVPLRHGMTIGELAQMINVEAEHKADLKVLPVGGWERHMSAQAFMPDQLPFVAPSPNLRSVEAIFVYAGTVLFEGTTITEGRGTDTPFQTIGAPFMEAEKLAAAIPPHFLAGAELDVVRFIPTASRYKGEACSGVAIQALDTETYRPIHAALALLATMLKLYPGKADFLASPPVKTPFFDLLIGQDWVRDALRKGASANDLESRWQVDLAAFAERRTPYLLYS